MTANLVGPGVILITLEDDSLPRLWCGDVDHFILPSLDAHVPSVDDDCCIPWFSSVGGTMADSSSVSSSS